MFWVAIRSPWRMGATAVPTVTPYMTTASPIARLVVVNLCFASTSVARASVPPAKATSSPSRRSVSATRTLSWGCTCSTLRRVPRSAGTKSGLPARDTRHPLPVVGSHPENRLLERRIVNPFAGPATMFQYMKLYFHNVRWYSVTRNTQCQPVKKPQPRAAVPHGHRCQSIQVDPCTCGTGALAGGCCLSKQQSKGSCSAEHLFVFPPALWRQVIWPHWHPTAVPVRLTRSSTDCAAGRAESCRRIRGKRQPRDRNQSMGRSFLPGHSEQSGQAGGADQRSHPVRCCAQSSRRNLVVRRQLPDAFPDRRDSRPSSGPRLLGGASLQDPRT